MKIPKQARREAKQLFRSCRRDGALDEGRVRQIVDLVIKTRPRGYLAILEHFKRLLKLDLEQRSARVETAVALSPDLRTSLQSSLTRIYGPGLNFSFNENPSLIGGVRIHVGSDVYDGSIRARLERLAENF